MARFALIDPLSRICQVEDDGGVFPVSPSMSWVEVPLNSGVDTSWEYADDVFTLPLDSGPRVPTIQEDIIATLIEFADTSPAFEAKLKGHLVGELSKHRADRP
jgi:hypothetical protein